MRSFLLKRWVLKAAVALLFVVVALRAALPTFVGWSLAYGFGRASHGGVLQVGTVDLSLWQGRVSMGPVLLQLPPFAEAHRPQEGPPSFEALVDAVTIEQVTLAWSWVPLFTQQHLVVRSLTVRGAVAHVPLPWDRGSLAKSEPRAKATATASPVPAEPAARTSLATLQRVEVNDSLVFIRSAPEAPVTQVGVQFEATDVPLQEGAGQAAASLPMQARFVLGEGELKAAGVGTWNPSARFAGSMRWDRLPLALIAQLTGKKWGGQIISGTTSGTLQFRPAGDDGSSFGGQVTIADLGVTLREPRPLSVRWQSLNLPISEGRVHPDRLSLGVADVVLNEPTVHLVHVQCRDHAPTGPDQALRPAKGPRRSPGRTGSAQQDRVALNHPLSVSVASLTVRQGRLHFEDRRVAPYFNAHAQLNARATALRWPRPAVEQAQLSGTVGSQADKGAAIALKATWEGRRGSLEAQVQDYDLTHLNPYATTHLGYAIKRGAATLEASLQLDRQHLAANSTLKLDAPAFARFGSARRRRPVRLPNAFELFLMQDASGNITLPIEMRINPGGKRHTALAPMVWSALRQSMLGVLSAPLKGMQALLSERSDGGVPMAPFRMQPREVSLDPAEHARLERLGSLLASRPGLAVELTGSTAQSDGRPEALGPIANERAAEFKETLIHRFGLSPQSVILNPEVKADGAHVAVVLRPQPGT